MLDHIREVLREKCGLNPEKPVLVGLSGGPDSLFLLDSMQRIGYKLVVAHLDHCLRPESGREAHHVQAMAEARKLPFFLDSMNVYQYASEKGLSIEEAARELRYHFLFKVAEAEKLQAVAVGHHADDQVETVLMHLLRGAGLDGLKGMTYKSLPNAWSDHIALVRPLLGVWREQILDYLAENNLQYVEDSSNLDTTFYRNRLRNELIPYLEGLNPGVKTRLWRMADILTADHAVLNDLMDKTWDSLFLESGEGYLALDWHNLRAQPLGIQRRLIRRAIAALRPGLRDIDYAAVGRALNFISTPPNSGRIDLIAGLQIIFEGEILWLADREANLPQGHWPQLSRGAEARLDIPGKLELTGGWELRASIVKDVSAGCAQALENLDPFQAWLDFDTLQLPLSVRVRRPGERFKPLGMAGKTMKLADFMVNVKLPQRARDSWPLVLSREEILWIPGYRLAHPFCITDQTNRLVHLIMERV